MTDQMADVIYSFGFNLVIENLLISALWFRCHLHNKPPCFNLVIENLLISAGNVFINRWFSSSVSIS